MPEKAGVKKMCRFLEGKKGMGRDKVTQRRELSVRVADGGTDAFARWKPERCDSVRGMTIGSSKGTRNRRHGWHGQSGYALDTDADWRNSIGFVSACEEMMWVLALGRWGDNGGIAERKP